MDRVLNSVYNNPSSPAYLAGINAVYREAKKKLSKLTIKDVREFLYKQDVYTLHKPIRKRFPRNRVIAAGLDTDWQTDLIDLKALAKYNRGFKYLLTCVDILSKYLWVVPIKNKKPESTVAAFKDIFKQSGRKPWRIMSDRGLEYSSQFREFMKNNGVHHFYATSPDVKCANVERANRTLKSRLWKHFTKNNTFTYLEVLPKIVHAINHSVSRMTHHAPADVNPDNERKVRAILYGLERPHPVQYKYKVGDQVRITKEKGKLQKGYLPNFTEEIFTIAERLDRTPATYRLKDRENEPIDGIFYESELSKVGGMYKRKWGARRS